MNNILRICTLFLLTSLSSCATSNSSEASSIEPKEYEIVEKQSISLSEFFLQEEEDYLIFIHADTCSHCKQIMGDVAQFAEDNLVKTYFLNASKEENKMNKVSVEEVTVGVDNLDDLCYAGTPTIFEIEKGVTTAHIPGKDKCLTFLNEIRKNNL